MYTVKGYIKKQDKIITKNFSSVRDANKFIDNMLYKYDCQVAESYKENNKESYYCEDQSTIVLESI